MTQKSVANAEIVKVDDEKRLVFGWASIIKDENGKILLDRQDDFIDSEDELEGAAYDYVLNSRDGGEMHVRRGVAKMVESVVFTEEKQRALGIPVGSMPTGWWIGFKVTDDSVWNQVKKGQYSGFSVHGTGRRESTQIPVSKITEIGKADKKKKNKIATVMSEFKAGKLKSSSGEKVTDPKQAMAIAISEQKRAKMKKLSISEIISKSEKYLFAIDELNKGDRPGHPFRGNQHTSTGPTAGKRISSRISGERSKLNSTGTPAQKNAYQSEFNRNSGEHVTVRHTRGMKAAENVGYSTVGGTRVGAGARSIGSANAGQKYRKPRGGSAKGWGSKQGKRAEKRKGTKRKRPNIKRGKSAR